LTAQLDAIRLTVKNIDGLVSKRMEILGGIDKDELGSNAPDRLSSDYSFADGARPNKAGESRQVQQLRSQSSAQASSRGSSVSSSRSLPSHPPGTMSPSTQPREDSFDIPPRLSSLPRTPSERTDHSIFQPPPPESPEQDFTFSRRTLQVGRENEAETLRRRLRFHRTSEHGATMYEFLPEHNNASTRADLVDVKEVSLSHVLTNVVILHHFVLELAAVMQTRATLFEDVIFV